jgi:hypothetical protein
MAQMSLNIDEKSPFEQLLLVLDNTVSYLGLKEVAFKLDVAKSTLCDAMKDRNDRRWAQEWTLVVLEMLSDQYTDTANQFSKDILDAQARITRRFEVVLSDDEPTAEEVAAAKKLIARAERRKKAA